MEAGREQRATSERDACPTYGCHRSVRAMKRRERERERDAESKWIHHHHRHHHHHHHHPIAALSAAPVVYTGQPVGRTVSA
eukprot:14028-Prymnesium_polylepis.1